MMYGRFQLISMLSIEEAVRDGIISKWLAGIGNLVPRLRDTAHDSFVFSMMS